MSAAQGAASADLVLGVDASTTAVKAFVWDRQGRALAEGRAGVALSRPAPDGYEQDALGWWAALQAALRQAVGSSGIDGRRLAGLALAHQRETFVVTDGQGTPRRPAIAWMDERCRPQVERVATGGDADRIHRTSGKPVCATPSLYKLLWLREHEPELLRGDVRVLDVHAFLVHRLTGRFVTSPACADPLGLVDLASGDWAPSLLALAGLQRAQLAALRPVGSVLGQLTGEAAAACGLPAGLPVVAGAGDGQAAALGAGISGPGRAYLNLGTAVVAGVVVETPCTDTAFRTMTGAAPGTFLLESDLKGGTFTLDWLVERWLGAGGGGEPGPDRAEILARLEAEARLLPPGAQGLVLVPYWCGVMNPYWDDAASGLVLGWRGRHGPAHLFRALLEGIAFEQRLALGGIERALGSAIAEVVVLGGGARSELWCQIIADVLQRPVCRAGSSEATALGAAMLAAWATGLFSDLPAAVQGMCTVGQTFRPGPAAEAYALLYREVYAPLYPALRPLMERLARLEAHPLPPGCGTAGTGSCLPTRNR